jgi:hypothetical protein
MAVNSSPICDCFAFLASPDCRRVGGEQCRRVPKLAEILQMKAPLRPRLRPLASFCKTDPSLWVADALRSASGSGRDPNDRQVSVIKTPLSRCFVDMRNAECFTRLI